MTNVEHEQPKSYSYEKHFAEYGALGNIKTKWLNEI